MTRFVRLLLTSLIVVTCGSCTHSATGDAPPQAARQAREWTFDELAPLLAELSHGHSFERGQRLFTTATCSTCHQMRGVGGRFGPDLIEIREELEEGEMSLEDVLWELVDPSREIEAEFRQHIVVTDDGRQRVGLVLEEDDQSLTLLLRPTEQVEGATEVIPLESIDERVVSPVSAMPVGLLNPFERDEILDLIAYLVSGGDPQHPLYAPADRSGR